MDRFPLRASIHPQTRELHLNRFEWRWWRTSVHPTENRVVMDLLSVHFLSTQDYVLPLSRSQSPRLQKPCLLHQNISLLTGASERLFFPALSDSHTYIFEFCENSFGGCTPSPGDYCHSQPRYYRITVRQSDSCCRADNYSAAWFSVEKLH